ncbi:diguanylate cyclase [Clostridium ganghwense]|uniref:Diguanylate cyclase n=1 Tax=Clostridium ganghwense TaxID=312089 RepID=A0ABT4CRM9_9CLOT|nr:diguanylate cyclase [Clostridium ganghwense]MCY6371692.1 diguanylate cyclase [Clostridium ganghwense]
MRWNVLPYTIPLWITLIFSIGTAIYIFKRRAVPGAIALFIMSLIMSLWSLGYIFELLSQSLREKIFWDNVQMLGGAMGVSCFAFALQYTKQKICLKRRVTILLAIEPVIIWILAVSNLTELFRGNAYIDTSGPFPALIYDMGIASWIDFAFGYVMYILFIILLIRFFIRSHDLYRKQASFMMIGLTITAGGYILSFLDLIPKYMRDVSPFTFTILNLSLFFSIYRYKFLNTVPIARETLFEKINDGLIVLDANKVIVDINLLAQTIINTTTNEVIGQLFHGIFPNSQEILKNMDNSMQTNLEISLKKIDQEYIYEVESLPLVNKRNTNIGWLIVLHDISERKKMEKALQISEEKYRNVCEFANDGIVIIQDGYIKYMNTKLLEMINHTYEEVINHYFDIFVIQEFRTLVRETYRRRIMGEEVNNRYEITLLCKNGDKLDVEVNAAVMNYNGRLATLGYIRDITERKRAEKALRELAVKDPLTQIFNRRHFFILAQKEFELSIHHKYSMCAIMIDIDHFKQVNDNYGHAIGDQVLCNIANNIIDSIRDTDVLGRYGGEEFAVFLPKTDICKAQLIAERIRKNIMQSSVSTDRGQIFVTASLGVAQILNFDEDDIDKLFDRADKALYTAKQKGRNKVIIYN